MPRRLRRVKHSRARIITTGMLEQLEYGHAFVGDGFGSNPDQELVRPAWEQYGAQLTEDLIAKNAELRSLPPAPTVREFPYADTGSGVPGIRRLRPWGWWLCEAPEQRNRDEETELEQLDRLDLMPDLERTLLRLAEA